MTNTDKLTDRKIYTAIAEGTLDTLDESAVIEWAEKKITQLDNKAIRAKKRAVEKKAEGDELSKAVKEALTDEFESIADIATRIDGDDVTVSKISYRLNALSKDETSGVEKGEIVVKNEDKKGSRKLVGYRLAPIE